MTNVLVLFRAMGLQHASFMLAHTTGNLGRGFVNRGIHVCRACVGFDYDVVRAKKDNLRDVAIILDVEDHFRLDDFGGSPNANQPLSSPRALS